MHRVAVALLLFATGCMPGNGPGKSIPPKKSPAPASSTSAEDIPDWAGERTDEPFDVRAFIENRAAPADNTAPLYVEALSRSADICRAKRIRLWKKRFASCPFRCP
jgi:hypothetical protein